MKKLSILMLMIFLSGCARLQQSEQAKAQFHTYSTATPDAADKLLFSDEDSGHAIHTTTVATLHSTLPTVDYSSNPVDTWGNRTDYAECDSIYQAINDSTIDFDSLPSTTEIVSGDELLLQKNDDTTSKIDAIVFRDLINEDLFGNDVVIVRPEDNLLTIIENNTAPQSLLLTQGTHTLDVTAHSSFLDLSGYRFMGYGKGQTFLNIITREGTVSRYIKLNGVLYFKDLSIDFSSVDVGNDYHILNDTADAFLYFLDCDVEQSTDEPYVFFGQSDNTKVFNLYIKNTTFLNDYTSDLFLASSTPQLNLYAADSSIGGEYTFNNTTSNVLKTDNCTFTQEIQFLNLDTNTIDYYLSDAIFRVEPVTSGEHAGYDIITRGKTNYILPTAGGGWLWEYNINLALGFDAAPENDNQYIPFQYWNLEKTDSVTERYRVRSQPVFSFNFNVTADTDIIFNEALEPFTMRFYLKSGSSAFNVATGHDGSGWTYTSLSPETLYEIKTVPCSTTFPVFPFSESDTKIQRQVIAW